MKMKMKIVVMNELDFIQDSESDSSGSLMLHLAATEACNKYTYTFEGRDFNSD